MRGTPPRLTDAHAATECIESYMALSSGQLPVLSQQQASFCTSNPNDCGGNGGCGGGTAEVVFASVAANGGMASVWTYPCALAARGPHGCACALQAGVDLTLG